jgi:capsular polysaccharide biosynthesis protein
MLAQLRRAAVTAVKPRVSDDVWTALRRLEPSRRERERRLKRQARQERAEALARQLAALPRPLRLLVSDLDALLKPRPGSRVALLSDETSTALADVVALRYPRARLTAVPALDDEPLRHARLAATGPYDLIIDAAVDRPAPAELYRSVLFHLRPGGSLAFAGFRAGSPSPAGIWPLVTRLVTLRDPAAAPPPRDADEKALARATGRVVVGEGHLVVRNATASLAKLREAEIGPLLEITGDRLGTVLGRIPAEQFLPRSTIRDHAATSEVRQRTAIDVPALSLREYNDVVCAPPQLVVKDNLLLPETYRHHLHPRLRNRGTTEVAPRFAQVTRDLRNPERLPGAYFHFDSEWPGHYGHLLTEQTSRLWGWKAAKARHPDLKLLLGRRPGATGAQPFERAVVESVGVPTEDIVVFDRPVRVDRLLAATPMFSYPQYVSPRIATIWRLVGATVEGDTGGAETPRRSFCGREMVSRSCRNSAEVERAFADSGFDIVFPAHLPFAQQVAMFRNADVVAGYAGSALFTLCFCAAPKRVLMLSSESYRANNEYLIAAVLGHDMDVFWSVAESPSMNAGYTFDFRREGRLLREVLADLPRAVRSR